MEKALKAKLAKLSPEARQALLERLSSRDDSAPVTVDNSASYQQEQFWLLHHFSESPAVLNVRFSIDVQGRLDLDILQKSLNDLVRQADVFRFRFPEGSLESGLLEEVDSRPNFEHLQLPEGRPWEIWLNETIELKHRHPFDLEKECPLRCVVFEENSTHFNVCLIVHHIALDGTSFAALWTVLSANYQARTSHHPGPDRPAMVQYRAYTWRQIQRASKVCQDQNRDYWVNYLEGSRANLELPEPAKATSHIDTDGVVIPLSAGEYAAARDTARRLGLTENVFFLATYFALLAETFKQRDICIGTPAAVKPDPDDQEVIGCCISMLCLRGRFRPGMTFKDLLESVSNDLLLALSHADNPMQHLSSALNRTDAEERNLYQTIFQYRNYLPELKSLGEAQCRLQNHRATTPTFPLVFEVIKDAASNGVTLALIADPQRFSKCDGDRMLARYRELLATFAEDVSSLVIPAAEVLEIPLKQRDYPLEKTVVEFFLEQVQVTPKAPAVEGMNQILTYAELDNRSMAIAHTLLQNGIEDGDIVALCTGRSPDSIAGILGILRAGGVYLPLDTDAPEVRNRLIVEDSGAKLILHDVKGEFESSVRGFPLDMIPEGSEFEPIDLSRNDKLAYIIYTSGSTGKPKGVMIGHRALTNFTLAARDYMKMSAEDRFLQFASFTFDASIIEIFPTLVVGGSLVLRTDEMITSPARFFEFLDSRRISAISIATSFWHELVQALNPTSTFPEYLRLISIGGERASKQVVNRWLLLPRPRPELLNTYGPTECTVVATLYIIPGDAPPDPVDCVPIGRLLPNLTAKILGDNNQPVGQGEAGELCLGGVGLFEGYRGQDQLTLDAFIDDPLSDDLKVPLYRTGDRVRLLEDGNLDYLGRLDDQVKIRGFRVEPMEVESAIGALPGVTGSCVIAVKDASHQNALAAYVTLAKGVSLESIKLELASQLPNYLQPAAWTVLETFPKTLSRKIDRRALPPPGFSSTEEWQAPESSTEVCLATIWKDLLKIDRVGRKDNFFALGGHSLLIMRLFARVEEEFQNRPNIVSFLEEPVLCRLAENLDEAGRGLAPQDSSAQEASASDEKEASGEASVEMTYPASIQQRYFHDLDTFSGKKDSIIARLPIRTRGPFDIEAFRRAIMLLVERHDIYRTIYRQSEAGLEAVVLKELEPVIDFQNNPGKSVGDLVEEMLSLSTRAWNLETESPLHVAIRRIDDLEHLCILSFHHIACDGGSWRLFSAELSEILKAANSHAPMKEVGAEGQFSLYAVRQAERLGENHKNLEFWMEKLRGLPAPSLPPRESAKGPSDSNTIYQLLPKGLWERAQKVARTWRTTPHNLMMAAFHAWHFRYIGGEDVTIGTPLNARLLTGDQDIHGCAVCMLPIRQQMKPGMTFVELQQSVQVDMLEAMEHAEINLLDLQERLAVQENRRDPIYGAVFQIRNLQTDLPTLFPGTDTELLRLPRHLLQVPLHLQIHLDQADTALSLGFDLERTSPEAAERMLKSFLVLLENLLSHPEAPMEILALVDSGDRECLVNLWARKVRDYPRERSVSSLFDEIQREYPDRPALVDGDVEMTYSDLARRTEQQAAALRQRGIGPQQRVGVCMERSVDLIVAMIAVLRTGAAYVPIDPEYPINRLRFMVEDAQATVVLTHRPCFPRLRAAGLAHWLVEDLEMDGPEPVDLDLPDIDPLDPAYLMYTSGTTGEPKASLIPHRGIVRLVRGADYASLGSEETFLLLASTSFDASTFEIWGPLLNGGKLVIMPPGTPTLSDIGEVIGRCKVTTLWLTARLFDAVIDEAPGILAPLNQLLTGGDTLSPLHVARCRELYPDLVLVNGYGPTENTTFSCCYRVPGGVSNDKPIPIGQPIANSEAFVLDRHRQLVPVGALGELYLGGDGLSLGYWKRPELNEQFFVQHPFSTDANARLYRTGDLARFLPDGNIEFVGRSDHQVKIRGFRVELSEVERVLEHSTVVERCCVLSIEEETGKALAVAVIPSSELAAEDALSELRQYANANLPRYLQPERWLTLDVFPLTQNGKLDRKALEARFAEDKVAERAIISPESRTELQLLEIWQRLLQKRRISTDDDFFLLGGDSLTAMRLIAEIERRFDRRLPLTQLFRHPTISKLGSFIEVPEEIKTSTLVSLREGAGGQEGLFIVHGWGGEVYGPRMEFSKSIPGDFPIYGIQAVEHSGETERLSSFEAMAERYAKDILEQQPEGPYFLCGYSLGGMIAYETARQLHQLGCEIGRLIVFDTRPMNLPYFILLRIQMRSLISRLPHHFGQIMRGGLRGSWKYVTDRVAALKRRLQQKKPPNQSPRTPAEIEVPANSDYYSVLNDHYQPRPFPVSTMLFRAEGSPPSLVSMWRYLSRKNVLSEKVLSTHHEMLRDTDLARRVGELLKRTKD